MHAVAHPSALFGSLSPTPRGNPVGSGSLRVVHVAGQLRPSSGIERQMELEQEAADLLGLNWSSLLFRPAGVSDSSSRVLREIDLDRAGHDVRTWVRFRRRLYRALSQLDPVPDVLLLRHSFYDPFQARFVQGRPGMITVHHTIEDAEIASLGGRACALKRTLERRFGGTTLQHVSGVCALTSEILEHELARSSSPDPPAFVYPNGALLDSGPASDSRAGLRLVFVASEFAPWQGLEELVAAVGATAGEFALDVVGALSETQRGLCANDPRIVVHGLVGSDELSRVLAGASAGIAALQTEGKGLSQVCSLKVRDYLAAGVPVVSGHRDVFPDDFPFYRQTGADLHAILEAAREWRDVDRLTVREAARPHIDKVELVRRLHSELEAVFAEPDA